MKKITLLLVCFSLNITFSQVIFEDDFDGSGPGLAAWTLHDIDGNTPDGEVQEFTAAWIEKQEFNNETPVNRVAMSTSWYNPTGTSDDWMVTPPINLTGLEGIPILTWEENSVDSEYRDSYEVKVSTTGNTPEDFTDAPIYSIANAATGAWAAQSVNLNTYVGNETVYIAWRNISNDKYVLQINNVKVAVPEPDAGITTAGETQDQYTQIPLKQIAPLGTNATITNTGNEVVNAIATVTVTEGTEIFYTASSASFEIAVGANKAVTFTGYTPIEEGTYTSTYSVAIRKTDAQPSNNTFTKNTEVTTNTYARDDGIINGSLGIARDNGGYLGQQYDILESQDISSVTFVIANKEEIITGLEVRATVWDMVDGVPDAIVAATEFVTVTNTLNDTYTANIIGEAFALAPGQYLVAIEQPTAENGLPVGATVQLAITETIFTPGTTWINWPENPNGSWSNSEDFGFNFPFLIRPNFRNTMYPQVLFEDDFDGSGPGLAAWTLHDIDGNTPDVEVQEFTAAWIEKQELLNETTVNRVAMSTSWYNPTGTSDDWMVTPPINLTGLEGIPILTWEENSVDSEYRDSYEVKVSTTGNTPEDFTDAPIYSIANAATGAWAAQSVNLNTYVGNETVYIAWRNISNDKYVLQINNVKVAVPEPDAGITTAGETQDQYTQIPLKQIAPLGTNATITNTGNEVVNAIATVTVTEGTEIFYTASSASFEIAVGANKAVTFTGYTPIEEGTYTSTYSVAIRKTDAQPSNNTFTKNTEVTTNTYARDDGIINGSLGIARDNGGYLGQQYDILESQDISSVTFVIANKEEIITGLEVRATVWDMVDGVPDAIVAATEFVTVTNTLNDTYTANIIGEAFALAPGQYLVAIEQPTAENGLPVDATVQLAITETIFTPGTTWINWPENPNGSWSNSEDFGFNFPFLIRPNFQNQSLAVEDFNLENNTIVLYPNPSSDIVTISNPNQLQLKEAIIIDVTGRVVKTYDLGNVIDNKKTIDVSSLSTASYFITIKSSTGQVTKKLIIN
jgi:hypothetical protein